MALVGPNGIRAEPTGDPARIKEPVSAWTEGVPITVLASPKMESMSSRRTPQVSG